jgi:hypothetical protein
MALQLGAEIETGMVGIDQRMTALETRMTVLDLRMGALQSRMTMMIWIANTSHLPRFDNGIYWPYSTTGYVDCSAIRIRARNC